MKKIFLIGILCLSIKQSFGCDICGCSTGNYFIGPFPSFNNHFFGTRYTFRSFNSRMAEDASQFSKDFYQTAELWGGVNLGKKWQIFGFIPYNINRQKSDDGISKNNGLGDVTVIANYKLFGRNSMTGNGGRVGQQLWLGGGVKLPTGKFKADEDDIIPDANNQPGTGSVDFLVNAMYSMQVGKWGLNSNVNYKVNNDADHFQFGNRLNASAFVFRSVTAKSAVVSPNAGLLFENLQANKLNSEKIEATGGHVLSGAVGVETNFNRVVLGFNLQMPVAQNLSDRQTDTKLRGMAHLTFAF